MADKIRNPQDEALWVVNEALAFAPGVKESGTVEEMRKHRLDLLAAVRVAEAQGLTDHPDVVRARKFSWVKGESVVSQVLDLGLGAGSGGEG